MKYNVDRARRSYASTVTTKQKRHEVFFPQMTQLVTPNKVLTPSPLLIIKQLK